MSTVKINQPNSEPSMVESFPKYAFEIIADIFLGIVLGVSVNFVADYIGKTFKLPFYGVLIIQLILIIIVLYVMKIDSKYLYESWKGQTSYGIIFTAVFLAVQRNMMRLFQDIFVEGENRIGILMKEHGTNYNINI